MRSAVIPGVWESAACHMPARRSDPLGGGETEGCSGPVRRFPVQTVHAQTGFRPIVVIAAPS